MARRRKRREPDPEVVELIEELRAEANYFLELGRRISAIRRIHKACRLLKATAA